MAEFSTVPLEQVSRLLSGGTPSKAEPSYWSGPIPWLTPKDMASWDGSTEETVSQNAIGNGTRLAPEGAVFIAVRGMSLHNEIRIVRSHAALTFNQDIKAIVPKEGIDGRFLYYALAAKKPELLESVEAAGHGTGRLPTDRLKAIAVPRVTPAEQTAIASCLGALDSKIELNRQTSDTLESMARAIFNDWFVDWGPTRAKMEGRPPYLAPNIWELFPDRMDADGNPEGWKLQPLSTFMSFRGGSQPPATEFADAHRDGYVRLLQIRDFYTRAHVTYVPKSDRLRLVDTDDICIGRYGSGTGDPNDSLGRLCRGLCGAINVALIAVKPLFYCREWLATYIGAGYFRSEISGGSARAVQAGFRKEDLEHITVTRASDEVHRAFEAFGTLVWEQKKRSLQSSETLAATRDLLLPKLMSGEIRLKDGEKMAEAVL